MTQLNFFSWRTSKRHGIPPTRSIIVRSLHTHNKILIDNCPNSNIDIIFRSFVLMMKEWQIVTFKWLSSWLVRVYDWLLIRDRASDKYYPSFLSRYLYLSYLVSPTCSPRCRRSPNWDKSYLYLHNLSLQFNLSEVIWCGILVSKEIVNKSLDKKSLDKIPLKLRKVADILEFFITYYVEYV